MQGRSLGELCHIVQLAIGQKQLLGHAGGAVVPYGRSEACLKFRRAVRQEPASMAMDPCGLPFATWAALGPGLRTILAASRGPFPGTAAVSTVKSLFLGAGKAPNPKRYLSFPEGFPRASRCAGVCRPTEGAAAPRGSRSEPGAAAPLPRFPAHPALRGARGAAAQTLCGLMTSSSSLKPGCAVTPREQIPSSSL